MFSLSHIIWGLIAITLGVLAIKYTFQLVGFTGRQEWIESKLGSGSTYLAYKIFAILLIAFGVIYMLGLGKPVGEFIFSPLTNLFVPSH